MQLQRRTRSGPFPPTSPSGPRAAPPCLLSPRDAPRCREAALRARPPGRRRSRAGRRSRLSPERDPPVRCSTQTPSIPTRRGCRGGSTGCPELSPRTGPPPSPAKGLGPSAPPSSRRRRTTSHATVHPLIIKSQRSSRISTLSRATFCIKFT